MMPNARTIYERFRAFPGSDWIAKPEPIAGVIQHIAETRPRAILEVGAGIGTLTHAIVSTLRALPHSARVVSIENDAFCLAALREHLGDELADVELVPDSDHLEKGAFDFVIVDGGTLERGGYAELLAGGGFVLVEGGRGPQRSAMEATGRRFITAHVGSADWDGGWYWLLKFEPTMGDRIRFVGVRLWAEKLVTVRRRLRQAGRVVSRMISGRARVPVSGRSNAPTDGLDRSVVDARAIYERFRAYPGSQYIAKAGAIHGVSEQLVAFRPSAILEVGAGIGTLTHTILATLESIGHGARVVSIEDNAFCLAELARNLGPALTKVELRHDTRELNPASFDFVIVDGGTLERGAYAELVAPRGRVLVEGFREHQRSSMRQTGRACTIREVWHGGVLNGGYWIIQFEPTLGERFTAAFDRTAFAVRGRAARLARRLVKSTNAG